MQHASESLCALTHNVQSVVSGRFACLANPDAVVANADAVRAIHRRYAANGNFAGLGVLNRIQNGFPDDLQQMHLFLGVKRQGGETTVEVQPGLRLALQGIERLLQRRG